MNRLRCDRSMRGWGCALLLVTLTGIVSSHVASAQYRIIGYYPMWKRTTLSPQAVKFNILTHIMHAFAWPNANGTITSDDAVVDTGLINTTHRAGRKILLSFGGAGTVQTSNFSTVAADSNVRHFFISNVVSHLTTYQYDGADLDWEGPATVADRVNEVALVRELRAALDAVDPTLLLTMAVGVTNWSGQWRDFSSLKQYVDWIDAMTYDFHGSWSSHVGHNAPLYPGDADGSVNEGIIYLNQTRGIPAQQLVLGLPFYGKEYSPSSALYGSFTTEIDRTYPEAVNNLAHNWTYVWDSVSQVPYLLAPSGTKVFTFDDTTSITLKCEYAKTKDLSGVMIWEISQDLVLAEQPLLDAVGKTMQTTLGVPLLSENMITRTFVLYDNYPNPFNPSTHILYGLPAKSRVTLTVYSTLGQEVARLVDGEQDAGFHEVTFDAGRLASGMYFYRLRAGEFAQTKRLLFLR